jgi:hypothetical protein
MRFVKTVISNQVSQDYSEWFIGHAKSPYYAVKEPERREIYATKCMKYLTFLVYTTLEARGKSIEANLREKDREIAGLKDKYDTDIALLKDKYDTDIALLKEKHDTDIALLNEAVLDMQQLLKNPEKLAEISRASKPEIIQ